MVKITKLFALPKLGSLRGSASASLKIGEILAIRIGQFLKLGFALNLRYLLTDLLLIQTKLALLRPPSYILASPLCICVTMPCS